MVSGVGRTSASAMKTPPSFVAYTMPPSKNEVRIASCFPFSNEISSTHIEGCSQYAVGNVASGVSHRSVTSPSTSTSVPIRLDVVVGGIASNKDKYSEKSG